MIRTATLADTAAILSLAVASGLFPPDGTDELACILDDGLKPSATNEHHWIVDDDGETVGVAYFARERMTSGTWNLQMIAVHPARQGQGHGIALVRHVEQVLASRGERLLLVETSGLPEFESTWAFYRKCGFQEESRIRDYYKPGDDKITYRKELGR